MRRLLARSARGNQLAEFSIILPLLLILALGAVDLGRGLISYMELEQAAQEGAIYGSFRPESYADITSRVRTSSTGIVDLSDVTNVDVEVLCPPDVPAGKVGVRIRYTLEVFTPLINPIIGESIPLETRSIGTNFTDATCEPTP
jgi:hypothetical protein